MSRENGRAKPAGRDYSQMPEPIPDSPENIMRALVNTPPKEDHEWDYVKDQQDK